jgi:hypothetical protein
MADAVRVEGLADVRTSLRKLERTGERREVTRALKEGATVVATTARPFAAKRTGRLAASYRAGAAGNAAFVRSRVPYAAVQEFGGVIRPKGAPVRIHPHRAVTRALESKEEAIVAKVDAALDAVFRAAGWR